MPELEPAAETMASYFDQMYDLSGKSALITGASKGIGKAFAMALAHQGADIVVTSRNEEELQRSLDDILNKTGRKGAYLVADHSEWEKSADVAKFSLDKLGKVDILVNNAGTGLLAQIDEMTDEQWNYILNLNLNTPMALIRALSPSMKQRQWGRIINMSSLFGIKGLSKRAAYSASKGALISMSKALCAEFATDGITVNCLAAGPIRTPLLTESWNDPQRRQALANLTPMNRWGEPEELAGMLVCLASDAGAYITGQTILVDGGASAV